VFKSNGILCNTILGHGDQDHNEDHGSSIEMIYRDC